MKFSKSVVKHRVTIIFVTIFLVVLSIFGMVNTRINYDMLDYLPDDIDTVIGQNELLEDFGKGAFSFVIIKDTPLEDVSEIKSKIEKVNHVEAVIWYDSIFDISVPMEMLPKEVYDAFNTEDATMLAVFFDSSTSRDITMDAIKDIRKICNENCFVSGMSALVTDLKELCEKEEPIYVAIAVRLACLVMIILLDSWLVPFIFLISIGMAIVINLGSNYFMGEISYITKALSAVLQLAVTMDFSIFLWHSYNEELTKRQSNLEAMEFAINDTLNSVLGSSITTIAGFISLCFMTFTLGKDLGIVMAKGVFLGVIGCVTVLPAMILVFDKPLQKTKHRSLIPPVNKFSEKVLKIFPAFLILFVALIPPALNGYSKTNSEVYYDMGECLPKDIKYVIANDKLSEEFGIASTHMVLVDSDLESSKIKNMMKEMEQVDGVKYALGLETFIGEKFPKEFIPKDILNSFRSDNWELLLLNSEYKVASDKVNNQLNELNRILKSYDKNGMLIGEAPCMKDMIETTDRDFKIVNAVSIIAIFIIIAIVEKSIVLPIILISVIEFAVFINLGIPHYLGTSLPFIAPICISTIQLGATVDYAILMTTRYKTERTSGKEKKESIFIALSTSIPSIIVSGMGLFSATFGVAIYSDIDIISSMCMLMARGALISIISVILILPALLMLCDKIICKTTVGMKQCVYMEAKNE